ncbi:MAG: pentapeptide repeat-containing protein [Cyanobacteria bacterium]|nr:pentapeptide repeat-containing protein [Cyanobacteriota bacterium]
MASSNSSFESSPSAPLPQATVERRSRRRWLALRRLGAWTVEVAIVAASVGVPLALGHYATGRYDQRLVPLNPVLQKVEEAIARTLAIPSYQRPLAVAPLTNLFWSVALVAPIAVGGAQLYLLAVTGQTTPKRWFGVQVTSRTGRSPGLVRLVLREGVGRWGLPSILAYGIWLGAGAFPDAQILFGLVGLLVAVDSASGRFSSQGRTFHDRLAGTYVIDAHTTIMVGRDRGDGRDWLEAAMAWGRLMRRAMVGAAPAPAASGEMPPANPSAKGLTVSYQTDWLWYWMRRNPGAAIVTAAALGTTLVLGTFVATQIYIQKQNNLRAFEAQSKQQLLELVNRYGRTAPDERRGAILALGSVRDRNPELSLLANFLGQEDDPALLESIQQALSSAGLEALPYLQQLNRALRADLDAFSQGSDRQARNRVALRLRASQRAIAKILRLDGAAATGTLDLSRIHLGETREGPAQFSLVLDLADLSGFNLRSAILMGASFKGTQFHTAGPDGRLGTFDDRVADLSGAELKGANLSNAKLSATALVRTSLVRAIANRTNFSGAKVVGANLSGIQAIAATWDGADLSGASVTGGDLSNGTFDRAILHGLKGSKTTAIAARFNDADLTQAVWRGSDLSATDFNRADLTQADLAASNLSESNLQGAILSRANLAGANLTQADLRGARLDGADFKDALLVPASSQGDSSFVDAPASDGESAIVRGVDFSQVKNLSPRNLSYVCAQGGIHPQCGP